jgi:hypothetical protein
LYPFSLCINAGDPNYVPEPNETDLDGNPRVIAGRIDMGAYESNHIEAHLYILPIVINRHSQQQRIWALLRPPDGIAKDDIDGDTPLLLYPDEIEPTNQYILPLSHRPKRVSIIAYFDKHDLTDVISNNGKVELKLVGRLKTGQYFYGTDTIRINTHDLLCLASLASHWLDTDCTAPDWCGAPLTLTTTLKLTSPITVSSPTTGCTNSPTHQSTN